MDQYDHAKSGSGRIAQTGSGTTSADHRDWRVQLHRDVAGKSYSEQTKALTPPAPTLMVQPAGMTGEASADSVKSAAARGIQGTGGPLPYLDRIQPFFAGHDLSNVQAHVGGPAADASRSMGASAYATGNHVAFRGQPDLHTAAHEAAHVVQQRGGVSLEGGVGKAADPYEKQADAVADRIVSGMAVSSLQCTSTPSVQHPHEKMEDSSKVQRKTSRQRQSDTAPAVSENAIVAIEAANASADIAQENLDQIVSIPDEIQASIDGLDNIQMLTLARKVFQLGSSIKQHLTDADKSIRKAEAADGGNSEIPKKLDVVRDRIDRYQKKLDRILLAAAMTLTCQYYRDSPVAGSIVKSALPEGDTLLDVISNAMWNASGYLTVATEVLYPADILSRLFCLPDFLESKYKKEKDLSPLESSIRETVTCSIGYKATKKLLGSLTGRAHLFVLAVIRKFSIPVWKTFNGSFAGALLEAEAEDAGINLERYKFIKADVEKIKKELDSFLYASDDKLTALVSKYEGAEREMLFKLLIHEKYYTKLFTRGDAKKLDELRKGAGRYADDQFGGNVEMRRFKMVNGKRVDTGAYSSERELAAQHGTGLSGLTEGAKTIGADTKRNLAPGACDTVGSFFDRLGELPIVGTFFSRAGKNLHELANEFDVQRGNELHFGKDVMKWRRLLTDSWGIFTAELLLSVIPDVHIGKDLDDKDPLDLFKKIRESYKGLDSIMGVADEIFAYLTGLPAAKTKAEKDLLLYNLFSNVGCRLVDNWVSKQTGEITSWGKLEQVRNELLAQKDKVVKNRILSDEDFQKQSAKVADLSKRVADMVKGGDNAQFIVLSRQLREETAKLNRAVEQLKKQAEIDFLHSVQSIRDLEKLVKKIRDPRARTALVFGMVIKFGLKWLAAKAMGADNPRINAGMVISAIPDVLYKLARDWLVDLVGYATAKVTSWKPAAALTRLAARITIGALEIKYEKEIDAFMKCVVQQWFDELAAKVNAWIEKHMGTDSKLVDTSGTPTPKDKRLLAITPPTP